MVNEILAEFDTITVEHVLPSGTIPPNTDVIITTYSEQHLIKSGKIFVPKTINDVYLISNIYLLSRNKESFDKCRIGIDPGERIGVAFFGDSFLIKVTEYSSVIDVIKTVILAYFNIPAVDFVINIGAGGGKSKTAILTRLKAIFKGKITINVIDETNTSKTLIFYERKYKKNLSAAIRIALMNM